MTRFRFRASACTELTPTRRSSNADLPLSGGDKDGALVRDACSAIGGQPRDQAPCLCGDGRFRAWHVQLSAPKGTLPHRAIGWLWVVLMLVISISAFWINELRLWGPWSPIHLLAIFTLAMLPVGVLYARRHHVARHRFVMISIFCGALVIAGLFTFVPGRIMHAVIVGH